jgi:hypothetical protein
MESFPVQLSGRATLTNRAGEPRTVVFADGCVVRCGPTGPRVGVRSGNCAHDIAPRRSFPWISIRGRAEFQAPTVSAYDILKADLPDGDYRIAVYLRPVDGPVIEIDAGTTDLAIPR